MNEPKKELGQHWLKDEIILKQIVVAAEISPDDTVLEIGPGLGTLTAKLIDTQAQILALEFDAKLISKLKKKFLSAKNVDIEAGDIRTFDFNKLPNSYKIVANIPYYLTSHLVRSISETDNPPDCAVLLVQKEVAERMCASPGKMSILTATAQFYFECSLGIDVPAEYFTPPPKVDSKVVILKRRSNKLFDVDEAAYFKLVKAGFSERRKTLRNSLSGGLCISKEQAEVILQKADIVPTRRAQELSLDDWFQLYKMYVGHGSRK